MQITSSAFADGQSIPTKYSCKGNNVSPPLTIDNVPQNAKSVTMIVHDPDSPNGTFIHWVLWNIDPTISQILEAEAPAAASEGKNDFGDQSYGGPCPHKGNHRYVFTLYALNTILQLPEISTAQDVLAAQEGHVIAQSTLTGTFSASLLQ